MTSQHDFASDSQAGYRNRNSVGFTFDKDVLM